MNKKWGYWLGTATIIIAIMAAGLGGTYLVGPRIGPTEIIGKAYINSSNDGDLSHGAEPADGAKILLRKVIREGDAPAYSTATIDETVVKNGEYRFRVPKSGEYVITPLLPFSGYGLAYYIGNNLFKAGEKKTIGGPTIIIQPEKG